MGRGTRLAKVPHQETLALILSLTLRLTLSPTLTLTLTLTPNHHPDPDPNPNQVPRQETLKLLKCAYGVGQQMAVAYYERGVRSLEQVVPTLTRTLTPSLLLTLPHL